jgi:hypothetical protein
MRGGRREGAGRKPGSVTKIDHEARQKARVGGLTPLEYLLSIMRDESEDKRERLDAAKAAAPYCHARLSSTELSGPNKGPIETREVSEEARLKAFMEFAKKTGLKIDRTEQKTDRNHDCDR